MELLELLTIFENNKNEEQAVKMKAYLRNQFEFLGISAPKRNELWREHFKIAKKSKKIDWHFVEKCWASQYREMQYLAVYYLKNMQNYLVKEDVLKLRDLAVQKSWWDTIDIFDRIIGSVVLKNPELNDLMLAWSKDENMWLRRIAIDHQLLRKEKTDTDLLEKIILNNLGSKEFFINKAIGWSLRYYSKINPTWVKNFIEKYKEKLAPLSIREASKYI